MKPSSRRPFFVIVLALAGAGGAAACGASINAVYESDVRFEHCMALEGRSEAKPTTQKSCWDEWVKYYTYGQTRDRVDYARMRQRQLSSESNFAEDPAASALAQRIVPEPTSVLAPPPMMITDAGTASDASADAADSGDAAADPPGAACAAPCRETWSSCDQACANAPCKKTCERKYRTCMDKCF